MASKPHAKVAAKYHSIGCAQEESHWHRVGWDSGSVNGKPLRVSVKAWILELRWLAWVPSVAQWKVMDSQFVLSLVRPGAEELVHFILGQ